MSYPRRPTTRRKVEKTQSRIPERRPSIFIGSSSEGLPIAKAIQLNLDRACDVTVWGQGVFGLSGGTLGTLLEKLDDFDFAILALTPDDMVVSRSKKQGSPRDNVLLELGMFIGKIGRERTFIVYDRTVALKIPSDLAGITFATYQPHSDNNLQSSLGAPCSEIESAIQKLGLKARSSISSDVDETTQFQIMSDLMDGIARQFLILMYEKGVSLHHQSQFGPGIRYQWFMNNLSGSSGFFSADERCRNLADAKLLQKDLRDKVNFTNSNRGHEFAKWLIDTGKKADYFLCGLGSRGKKPKNYGPSGILDFPSAGPKRKG